ncbi:L,D-transpeptidase catalytic domain [Ruegeria intermedia]|uniref:L,D-transpeptidase catalytic domain n=1 Tax=Ruegeria intermedia TaxID=996115 RepID=A0A1M4ZTA0_9RHOB|nr:L,D-transpeptidase [Ruegeria intermedia]SHF21057.1 L,D-transpeptidase catalytic domain [Ruegeria intermedia]
MGQDKAGQKTSRRAVIAGTAALALFPAPAVWAQSDAAAVARRNISAFRAVRWQDHFDSLKNGVILSDTQSKVLQYWSEDERVYRMYPTSVPLSEDLTKLGYTRVIRKVDGPSWRPTPAMKKRNPAWPDYVGPGPENPLGTHALYLSWQYYRIHGTNDTRKIGRRSSNGCIGLYNEQIAELFALAKVGTQVKLI